MNSSQQNHSEGDVDFTTKKVKLSAFYFEKDINAKCTETFCTFTTFEDDKLCSIQVFNLRTFMFSPSEKVSAMIKEFATRLST